MRPNCPYCKPVSDAPPRIVRFGRFYRKSDSRHIQRFRCLVCKKGFSFATSHPCFGQNKRQFNERLRKHFCSGGSQRRAAIIFNLSRTTVTRKFLFLAAQAQIKLDKINSQRPKASTIEFDEMESFEHSKCKPLSICIAVQSGTRHILGFQVARMPAKGKLSHIAQKKYGPRVDERPKAQAQLFSKIKDLVEPHALIKSDENPHYPAKVRKYFPLSTHQTYKGRRGCVVGQGELKRGGWDPIFSLNHTCAKLRADINRLFRRTWCTTKKPERLQAHIAIYCVFHNESLKAI